MQEGIHHVPHLFPVAVDDKIQITDDKRFIPSGQCTKLTAKKICDAFEGKSWEIRTDLTATNDNYPPFPDCSFPSRTALAYVYVFIEDPSQPGDCQNDNFVFSEISIPHDRPEAGFIEIFTDTTGGGEQIIRNIAVVRYPANGSKPTWVLLKNVTIPDDSSSMFGNSGIYRNTGTKTCDYVHFDFEGRDSYAILCDESKFVLGKQSEKTL